MAIKSKSRRKKMSNEKAPLLPKRKSEESSDVNGASFTGAVFNLSTTIIGAGIMALPAATKVLGLVPGIAMIILVAVLSEASITMLLNFTRNGKSDTYGGIMGDAFGNIGKFVLQACVVINNIGTLIVYMIILGDVLSGTSSSGVHHAGVLEGWFGEQWWNGRAFVLLITTLTVFAPLSSFKRIDSLKFTSAIAVGLALFFLVITAGITIVKVSNGSVGMPRLLPEISNVNSVWKLFTVVPVLVMAYICHFNVHTIGNELEDPSLIKAVVKTSLVLCSTIYIMTSFFGFLLFGDATFDDVLANFDKDLGIPYSTQLNDAVRISYALHLMLVFPIVFHPLRLNLDGLLFPSADEPLFSDNKRFGLITFVLICVIYMGANFIPSIWDAFQFTGATAAVCIGFIFPASITLKDTYGISTMRYKVLSVFMIGIAVFASSVAIYSDAYTIFKRGAAASTRA